MTTSMSNYAAIRPAPMTAAQHAMLKRIDATDRGLGVLLPFKSSMVHDVFSRFWIVPGEYPWCRDIKRLRFRLTAAGRLMMQQHDLASRHLLRIPCRRLPRA